MTAKEYLQQVRRLDNLIANKLAEKQQWYEMATGSAVNLTPDKVQTSGNLHRMEDAVARIVDIEREIDKQIDCFVDTKQEVIRTIEQLKPVEYDFLHKVYIQYKTLAEVAELYGYEYTWATTTHGRALKSLQNILDERAKK